MKVRVRQIGDGYGIVLPKKIIDHLGVTKGGTIEISVNNSGAQLTALDRELADQLAAFRRIEPKHRKSFRELAK